MAAETPEEIDEKIDEKKEDEVLEREGVEKKLMQKDMSGVGEELDDVQQNTTGE